MRELVLLHLYDNLRDELKGVYTSVESAKKFFERFEITIIKEEKEGNSIFFTSWNNDKDWFTVYELVPEAVI